LEQASIGITKPLGFGETAESRKIQIKSIRQHVSSQLRQMHAVQEVWARDSLHERSGRHLVLVLHWSFKQAAEASCGRTYWRNVHTTPMQPQLEEGTFATDLEQFDAYAPSAEVLAEARRDHFESLPNLQSPIVLTGEGYSAPLVEDATFFGGLQDSQVSSAFDVRGGLGQSLFDHAEPHDGLNLSAPPPGFGDYDDITLDLSRVPTDASLHQYSQQWDFCDYHLDSQLPTLPLDADDVYATPSATDSEHFSAFGHGTHDHHAQALPGAVIEIKKEEGSQGAIIFEHGCAHCVELPYCVCEHMHDGHANDLQHSQSSNGEIGRLSDVLNATLGEPTEDDPGISGLS